MKTLDSITLDNVKAVYSGAEGALWELIMGEQIHIGGLASSNALADAAGLAQGLHGVDLCCCSGAGMRFLVRFRGAASMRGIVAEAARIVKPGGGNVRRRRPRNALRPAPPSHRPRRPRLRHAVDFAEPPRHRRDPRSDLPRGGGAGSARRLSRRADSRHAIRAARTRFANACPRRARRHPHRTRLLHPHHGRRPRRRDARRARHGGRLRGRLLRAGSRHARHLASAQRVILRRPRRRRAPPPPPRLGGDPAAVVRPPTRRSPAPQTRSRRALPRARHRPFARDVRPANPRRGLPGDARAMTPRTAPVEPTTLRTRLEALVETARSRRTIQPHSTNPT